MVQIDIKDNNANKIADFIKLEWFLCDSEEELPEDVKNYIDSEDYKNKVFKHIHRIQNSIKDAYCQNQVVIKKKDGCLFLFYPDELYGKMVDEKFEMLTDIPLEVKSVWKNVIIKGAIQMCVCSVDGFSPCVVYKGNKKLEGCRCVVCDKGIEYKKVYKELNNDDSGLRGICSSKCLKKYLSYEKPNFDDNEALENWEDKYDTDPEIYLEDLELLKDD